MSATASEWDKHLFTACYSLPRVCCYIPLVVSTSPAEIEVTTSSCADWELPTIAVDSPASPDPPTHTRATSTTATQVDGDKEVEATSPKLDGKDDLRRSDESRLVIRRHRIAVRTPGNGGGQLPSNDDDDDDDDDDGDGDDDDDDNYRGLLDDCSSNT